MGKRKIESSDRYHPRFVEVILRFHPTSPKHARASWALRELTWLILMPRRREPFKQTPPPPACNARRAWAT